MSCGPFSFSEVLVSHEAPQGVSATHKEQVTDAEEHTENSNRPFDVSELGKLVKFTQTHYSCSRK